MQSEGTSPLKLGCTCFGSAQNWANNTRAHFTEQPVSQEQHRLMWELSSLTLLWLICWGLNQRPAELKAWVNAIWSEKSRLSYWIDNRHKYLVDQDCTKHLIQILTYGLSWYNWKGSQPGRVLKPCGWADASTLSTVHPISQWGQDSGYDQIFSPPPELTSLSTLHLCWVQNCAMEHRHSLIST